MTTSGALVEELRLLAVEAAHAGSARVRELGAPQSATVKSSSGDVVTEIDDACETAIREVLRAARPGDLIEGEEQGRTTGPRPEVAWSIDPIDGTTNMLRGLPTYGVSVAARSLISGQWLAAAVDAPALGVRYHAARRLGAWVEDGASTRRLSLDAVPRGPRLLASGLSYDPAIRVAQLADLPILMADFDDLRALGSAALALCALADGQVSAYVEADLYVFDWAAGALVAEEAGAVVSRHDGPRGALVATAPGVTLPSVASLAAVAPPVTGKQEPQR